MRYDLKKFTHAEIKKAYWIAAEVVKLYGDTYLPIFLRLHRELKEIDELYQIKTLALSVSSANVR